MGTTTHVSEEFLEAFVLKRLPAEEHDRLEDHLLICETCRLRLDETRQYIQVMRIAAARIRQEEEIRASRKPWWRQTPSWPFRPMWALAGAGVLAVLITVPLLRDTQVVYRDIALVSMRGGPESTVSTSANTRLRLRLDLKGVEQLSQYEVVMVDSQGKAVYRSGPVSPETREQLTIALSRSIPHGEYWVRLIQPGSEERLLREYPVAVR